MMWAKLAGFRGHPVASRPRKRTERGRDARAAVVLMALCVVLITGCGDTRKSSYPDLIDPPSAGPRDLDLTVDGAGLFIYKTAAGGFLFSPNGKLYVGANGDLVNQDGYPLVPRIEVAPGTGRLEVTPAGQVQAITSDANQRQEIGQIRLAVFPNNTRFDRDGEYVMPTDENAKPVLTSPGQHGAGSLRTADRE